MEFSVISLRQTHAAFHRGAHTFNVVHVQTANNCERIKIVDNKSKKKHSDAKETFRNCISVGVCALCIRESIDALAYSTRSYLNVHKRLSVMNLSHFANGYLLRGMIKTRVARRVRQRDLSHNKRKYAGLTRSECCCWIKNLSSRVRDSKSSFSDGIPCLYPVANRI